MHTESVYFTFPLSLNPCGAMQSVASYSHDACIVIMENAHQARYVP